MKTVWKFPFQIHDSVLLTMPVGAEVLSLQVQDDRPCFWALVDPQAPREPRSFIVHETGTTISDTSLGRFVGTFQTSGGAFVWHVWEAAR